MISKFIFIQSQEKRTEKEKLKETSSTRFKTCYRSTVIHTVWVLTDTSTPRPTTSTEKKAKKKSRQIKELHVLKREALENNGKVKNHFFM